MTNYNKEIKIIHKEEILKFEIVCLEIMTNYNKGIKIIHKEEIEYCILYIA